MYKLSCVLLLPLLYTLSACYSKGQSQADSGPDCSELKIVIHTGSAESQVLRAKAVEALLYCKKKKLNTDFCLLLNMNMHSGKKRFYIWSFKTFQATDSGLVSHGCGSEPWGYTKSKEAAVFSNAHESHCSSLGKYKIGARSYSDWGIHVKYIMHGLDSSNSNALKRLIVLHGWDQVGDAETFPEGTPEGWGCPAVSNTFMKTLDVKLKAVKTPVLLWQFS